MKKSLLTAAVGLAIATAPMAHADNPGSYEITLGGQTVAQGTVVMCSGSTNPANHAAGITSMDVHAGPEAGNPNGGSGLATIAQNGTQVIAVTIVQNVGGTVTNWGVARQNNVTPQATVVKTNDTWATNGKVTYNITGTATPTMPGTPGGPTPFEFDATCPALR
jgi:hypothetical protein